MNNYIVYIHVNNINGKVYIGKTCQSLEKRSGSNGCGYKACPRFYEAIIEYGWENFSHKILYENLSKPEAIALEIENIAKYNSCDPEFGYNLQNGGDGFDSSYSKSLWANESYAENIKNKNKVMWADEEYRNKTKQKMIDVWKDPEKRKNRSEMTKKRWDNNSFKEKAKQAIRNSCATKIQCCETKEIFETIVDACNKYGVYHSNILRSIRTGCRCGGYHWKALTENP